MVVSANQCSHFGCTIHSEDKHVRVGMRARVYMRWFVANDERLFAITGRITRRTACVARMARA